MECRPTLRGYETKIMGSRGRYSLDDRDGSGNKKGTGEDSHGQTKGDNEEQQTPCDLHKQSKRPAHRFAESEL